MLLLKAIKANNSHSMKAKKCGKVGNVLITVSINKESCKDTTKKEGN